NHALPCPQMELEDLVARPQRVQLRPAGRVLEGIVGAVVGAPSDEVRKVAALVVVLREKGFRRGYAVSENPPLQLCPLGRGHGAGNVDSGPCGPKEGERQKAEEPQPRHPRRQIHSTKKSALNLKSEISRSRARDNIELLRD